ncbi:MAG TPA: hypothetical protein VH092_36295 [Urbifossiella sp.]|nr:hypothetical protein [Urbifossiella sp.]
MFRLLTAVCSGCQNRFHVEAEVEDATPLGCRCPRCNAWFGVACGDGVPQAVATPWAIRAVRVEPG